MNTQIYEKIRPSLRYFLQGAKMYTALEALQLGEQYHIGVRKDGKMPEFQHQISQAQYARTLIPSLMYPEETIATILLHDIVEDCEVTIETIHEMFGHQIATAVELMTNKFPDGKTKKPTAEYYRAMIDNPIASFAKGADRMHNQQTMYGVFTKEKIASYISETEEHILPMLKAARKKFPSQEPAYQNAKSVLQMQIELLKHMQ